MWHRFPRCLACLAFFVAASPLHAQDAVLRGRVVSSSTQRPVSGAMVQAGGTDATTDAEGRFTAAVRRGAVLVVVTAEGFLPHSSQIEMNEASVEIEVVLVARLQITEDITVTGTTAPVDVPVSTIEVTPLQVRTVAGAGENVFRVLHTLPGVAAADEFGSRLTVRGGGPDQNLTMMDGIEIYNPYRLFGLTSAFNPETVESFELTAGGFSAKYGDRLSSILLIDNESRRSNRPGADAVPFCERRLRPKSRRPRLRDSSGAGAEGGGPPHVGDGIREPRTPD